MQTMHFKRIHSVHSNQSCEANHYSTTLYIYTFPLPSGGQSTRRAFLYTTHLAIRCVENQVIHAAPMLRWYTYRARRRLECVTITDVTTPNDIKCCAPSSTFQTIQKRPQRIWCQCITVLTSFTRTLHMRFKMPWMSSTIYTFSGGPRSTRQCGGIVLSRMLRTCNDNNDFANATWNGFRLFWSA